MQEFAREIAGVVALLAIVFLSGPAWSAPDAEALAAEKHLKACTVETDPQEVYDAFNAFCAAHFGAEKEPLVYKTFGTDLKPVEGGFWVHASETSAVIGFETSLPAKSYVEYGDTAAHGRKTAKPERFFYLHQHRLVGLTPGKTVHYRVVSVDERGNKLVGRDQTLTPKAIAGTVHLPGEVQGPPYVLDKANATYVLTKDLKVPGTAFVVKAPGIALDLDGHTVRYCRRGLTASKQKGFALLNGSIIQGTYKEVTVGGGKDMRGPNVLLQNCGDVTMAGMYFEHSAPQESCVLFNFANGNCEVHHNVFVDKGTKITNRHGAGLTELKCGWDRGNPAHFKVHHNLVKRARQNGLRFAREIYNNEIYIDSWSTNSFATGSFKENDDHHHNRVFGTGYNAYAFPWSRTNLNVHHNFVHMQAIDVSNRWGEKWGDINMLSGLRVTNYGKGGQKRSNLRYGDNVIIIRGRGKCEIRGTEFFSDETIKDLVCENTTIVAEAQDQTAKKIACIVAQGHFSKPRSLPVVYRNCHLISNVCNVRFGDSYGKGNNHHFVNCTFTKTGDRNDYHTFAFDGGAWNFGHIIRDCVFGPGTAYNDVWWKRTGDKSWYKVQWTLKLKAPPGTRVTIRQKQAFEAEAPEEPKEPETAFDGQVGPDGELAIPLTQCVIGPPANHSPRAGSLDRREIALTPHTVTIISGGKEVTAKVEMTKKRTLELRGGVLAERGPQASASTATFRGWRGDGTGRFPDADAPLRWGRISKTVKDLRNSAGKLDEADFGKAKAMEHGTIREWLILGPLAVDAEAKVKNLVNDEKIEGEAELQPAEGDGAAGTSWKKVETTGRMLYLNEHIEGLKDQMVYACTYLYSPRPRRVYMQLGMGAGRFWVNGEMQFSRLKSGDERPNSLLVVPLRKGWNTIMVKLLCSKGGQQFGGSKPGTAYVKLSLYGVDENETFETTNILWRAHLPEAGVVFKQRFSCFQPVIVGDKVFIASDPGFLICYDKNTGKQLWMRDTTAYDFVTDEERAASPELFKKIDDDMKTFRKIAYAFEGSLKERFELTRLCHEIRTALKKVNRDKYHYDTRQEPGNAAQPLTDGRFVYAWYYNNIAACFDLDGNRIWKAYEYKEGPQGRHGYYRCPMLIGDDFAVEVRNNIIGFDKKTGKANWHIPYKFNTYSTYNQKDRERSDETDIVSFRDMGLYKPGVGFVAWSSVVRSGDSLYGDGCHRNTLIRHRMTGGGDAPFKIRRARSRGTNVGKIITPGTYWSAAIGSAGFLIHDGLLYAMGYGGVLRVYDAETLRTVYERQLDFAPVTHAYPYPYGAGVCASPTLGGKHIYLWGAQGTTIVIEPGRTYKQVAKNRIESAIEGDLFTWREHYAAGRYYPECTVSSPIFDGKRIYYRAEEYVYCIGKP